MAWSVCCSRLVARCDAWFVLTAQMFLTWATVPIFVALHGLHNSGTSKSARQWFGRHAESKDLCRCGVLAALVQIPLHT